MSIYIEKSVKVEVIPGVEEDMVIRYSSEADPKKVECFLKSNPSFHFITDLKNLHKALSGFGGK